METLVASTTKTLQLFDGTPSDLQIREEISRILRDLLDEIKMEDRDQHFHGISHSVALMPSGSRSVLIHVSVVGYRKEMVAMV